MTPRKPPTTMHAAHMQLAGAMIVPTADFMAVVVHTAAMFLVMEVIALVVFEKVGLTILRRDWINLDMVWAAALMVTGVLSLIL